MAGRFKLIQPVVGEGKVVLHLRRLRGQFGGPAQGLQRRLQVSVLAVDGAQFGEFVGVVRIIKLFADGTGFLAQTLIELLPAFHSQPAFVGIALAQLLRQRQSFRRFLLAPFLAIDQSELIGNAGVVRSQPRSFLQPLFRGCQIALLEVGIAKVVGRVGKRRLGCGLGEILDRAGVLVIVQVESSQVVKDVGMISNFAAHQFELVTGFVGFMQFEKCYRQRKSSPDAQPGIGRQGSAKFRNCGIVTVLLQSVVTLAQMGVRGVRRGGLGCGLGDPQGEQDQCCQQEQDSSLPCVSAHGKGKIIICAALDVGAGVPPVRRSHGGLAPPVTPPCRAALDCTSEDARAYILRSRLHLTLRLYFAGFG